MDIWFHHSYEDIRNKNLIAALLETCGWLQMDCSGSTGLEAAEPSGGIFHLHRGERWKPPGHWRTLVGCESGFFFKVTSSMGGSAVFAMISPLFLEDWIFWLVTLFGSRWQLSRWIHINLPKFWSDSAKPSGWASAGGRRRDCLHTRSWLRSWSFKSIKQQNPVIRPHTVGRDDLQTQL